MIASQNTLKEGDTVIFRCDEWRNNDFREYDGEILSINDKGVDVIYLSGYRSRNDFIPFADVIAKLDMAQPYIRLENAPYKGHFTVFSKEENKEK